MDSRTTSERSEAAIWAEFGKFAWDAVQGRHWEYDNRLRPGVLAGCVDHCHFVAADRCAEAQLTAEMISRTKLIVCTAVLPDSSHQLVSFADGAAKAGPKLRQLQHVLFDAPAAPATVARHSDNQR